ncbi:F0F1 ATP synthase subunit B, partial [Escherichia coli]|nr:F0F1 ATP synthase subunit B [Escherichia coli]
MNSTDFILAASESVNPLLPNPWEILVTGVGFAVLLFIVIKVIAPKFEQSY